MAKREGRIFIVVDTDLLDLSGLSFGLFLFLSFSSSCFFSPPLLSLSDSLLRLFCFLVLLLLLSPLIFHFSYVRIPSCL